MLSPVLDGMVTHGMVGLTSMARGEGVYCVLGVRRKN